MARALRPATHLSQAQIDAVVMRAEADVRDELVRRAGLRADQVVVRALLPDQDLNAGGVTYDQWLTAALVAGTEYQFTAQALPDNRACVIYGVGTLDANPGIGRVRALSGTATVMAAWDTHPLWMAMDTMGIADEFPIWGPTDTVAIWLLPFLTKAGGERFVLLGLLAEPKGVGVLTK